jgi:hypothetical protein
MTLSSDLNLAPTQTLLSVVSSFGPGGGAGLAFFTPATMLDIGGATVSNNGGSVFGFTLAPAADFFVLDHFSLGMEVLVGYSSFSPPSGLVPNPQSSNTIMYGIAPRIGFDIPFGSSPFSIWPKVFFEHAGWSNGGAGAGYGNIQFLGAYAPILYHPTPHFYLGLGPNILAELGASSDGSSATSKITAYGAFASIGGAFRLGGS